MSARDSRLASVVRGVRVSRLCLLLTISLTAALICDWLREERVVFPAPLPKFNTVPASR